ncbi:hypothetical protein PInf_003180 [Phytophthora infestans]|nr:hypothetical protein PInf_003180 [Phytophthora infestans]
MSTVTVTAAAAPSSEAKERRYDAVLDAEETRKKTKRASVLFAVSVPIAKDDSVTYPCSALLSEATKTQSKKRKRKHKMKNKKNAQVSEEERLRAEGRRANPICKRKIVAHLRTHESVTPMSTVTVTAAAAPSSEAKERRYDAFLDAEETRKKTKRASVLFAVSVPIAKDDSVTYPCSALLSEATKTQSKKRKRKHKMKNKKNAQVEEERLRAEGRRANSICKRKIVAHLRTHESVTPMSTVTVTAAAAPSSEAKERRYDAFLDAEETRKMTKSGSVLFAVSVPIAKDDSVTYPCSALLSEATKTQSKKRKRKHKMKNKKNAQV